MNQRSGGFFALLVVILSLIAIANQWVWLIIAISVVFLLFALGNMTGFNERLYETVRRIWLGYP